jgi:phenylalanine-4-hydroxylase
LGPAVYAPVGAIAKFLAGIDFLKLSKPGIPDFDELNASLSKTTGWRVVAVPGLVPDTVFFNHLAHRRFVAGRFIRKPDQLDYLEEPDIFNDVFGHVPLLANPVFADYMEAYGKGGLRAMERGMVEKFARLYWYTVEFGLIRTEGALKIYGAGIVSSFGESAFSLDDPSPNRIAFDTLRTMRTPYRIDDYQQNYFVIDSFADLLRRRRDVDSASFYDELETLPDIAIGDRMEGECGFTHGTQGYARMRAHSHSMVPGGFDVTS